MKREHSVVMLIQTQNHMKNEYNLRFTDYRRKHC